ncbi:tetratricopeptide repeat protein [Acanthopleuribacter pedis]|uniref:Tetratricopeptide repeat protein n=1 Tax=Acanthopleuribacter pedis TaxID=442870 RepID=A0A8J7QF39_9BACT|nr:hypothetical protein [Acanthopleuribacter pedis]MBO1319556.1 hypothetical protein [Acanthopleuribacter pedis]
MTEAMTFKFKFLDSDGNEDSFLSKAGALSPEGLVLGEENLPVEAVQRATLHNRRFILMELYGGGEGRTHVGLSVTKGAAADLVKALNALASARQAKNHRAQLEEAGKGALFRFARCPHCRATVNLSEVPAGEQTACGYCDRLFSPEHRAPDGEGDFCLCDQCGYYGRVFPRTVFYFYFLFVLWGYQSEEWSACSTCMRKKAGWMVLANLLFLIGLPNALYQYFRSVRAIEFDRSDFMGLEKANGLVKSDKLDEAVAYYQRLTRSLPLAAGVYYNQGRAMMEKGQAQAAVEPLETALTQCGNFYPAYHLLAECYETLGQDQKRAELHKRYGVESTSEG